MLNSSCPETALTWTVRVFPWLLLALRLSRCVCVLIEIFAVIQDESNLHHCIFTMNLNIAHIRLTAQLVLAAHWSCISFFKHSNYCYHNSLGHVDSNHFRPPYCSRTKAQVPVSWMQEQNFSCSGFDGSNLRRDMKVEFNSCFILQLSLFELLNFRAPLLRCIVDLLPQVGIVLPMHLTFVWSRHSSFELVNL